ncbi:hypothetical protein JCM19235_6484 [Vibrio maritimus]|uniref:Uncharacterized protein n=1 Tax=Vibrio maritimus TaxID=990268 RepID=A0A090RRN7_9VIBR|nr:hypothetical protein JCM19235_6484 [Vibrio maritimus]
MSNGANKTLDEQEMTIKDLVNTPLKKAALLMFILTNIGMVAVPAALAAYGGALGWSAGEVASASGIGFAVNEVVLIASALLLGKPIVALVKSKIKNRFGKKK